jgi:hypothetical protein
MQFLGALLGIIVAVFLFFRATDAGLRAMLIGAGVALIFNLGRAAWTLEQKARRAQNAAIGVDREGLHLTDEKGQSQFVPWDEVEELGVAGGRLKVVWKNGSLIVGAREVEDGMTMVQLVMNKGQDEPKQPTNFIPLNPL